MRGRQRRQPAPPRARHAERHHTEPGAACERLDLDARRQELLQHGSLDRPVQEQEIFPVHRHRPAMVLEWPRPVVDFVQRWMGHRGVDVCETLNYADVPFRGHEFRHASIHAVVRRPCEPCRRPPCAGRPARSHRAHRRPRRHGARAEPTPPDRVDSAAGGKRVRVPRAEVKEAELVSASLREFCERRVRQKDTPKAQRFLIDWAKGKGLASLARLQAMWCCLEDDSNTEAHEFLGHKKSSKGWLWEHDGKSLLREQIDLALAKNRCCWSASDSCCAATRTCARTSARCSTSSTSASSG
jgi:hypothetical protein